MGTVLNRGMTLKARSWVHATRILTAVILPALMNTGWITPSTHCLQIHTSMMLPQTAWTRWHPRWWVRETGRAVSGDITLLTTPTETPLRGTAPTHNGERI